MVAFRPFNSPKRGLSWATRLLAFSWVLLSLPANAFELDIDNPESIKKGARTALEGMISYYVGNQPGQTPGMLPPPYYWWEVGAMFDAMIGFWFYTKDDKYNDLIMEGMLHQIGDGRIMPLNQTNTEGNDDQAFWAIATMTAAERNFPNPPEDKPQWLAVTQTVFNLQTTRWDDEHCDGGLRWQIFTWNNGYTYKNTVSNGCLFHLAARLARYTGNTTYNEWAHKIWDWSYKKVMTPDYKIYDGLDMNQNCAINHNQWSYNTALYLAGAAYMYNITTGEEQATWQKHIKGILWMSGIFFHPKNKNVMYEAICEPYARGCNTDQKSFKAYLSRWMALTVQMAPFTAEDIMPRLRRSAQAAAASCVGGDDGKTCSMKWYEGEKWDGSRGVGEQMCAMEVIQANLITSAPAPVTEKNGGTSKGDVSAGGEGDGMKTDPVTVKSKTTKGDQAGAAFATLSVFSLLGGMAYFMIS